jgi:hypothetical protein
MSTDRLYLFAALLVAACGGAPAAPGASPTPPAAATTLSNDASDPLANPPKYELVPADDAGAAPPKASPADLQAGLDLARAKLKTLPRYHGWQEEKERYDSTVYEQNGHVFVLFNTPDATDQEITIEVDVASKQIVKVEMGEA